ncbi:MAG: hypothetical protein FJ104_04110 [Deltaproteobacteria bacterium]|nr:hypothetical protein [Deltaproteobacteria bacterium]
MLSRTPKDLPWFCALTGALSVSAHGFTQLWLAQRLSSTGALAYIFIPVAAAVVGAIGALLGALVRWIWVRVRGSSAQLESTALLPALLALCVGASAGLAALHTREVEAAAMPRVFVDAGRFERAPPPSDLSRARPSKLLLDGSSAPKHYAWGGRLVEVKRSELGVQVRDTSSGGVINISAEGLDSVTSVHVAQFSAIKSSPPGLAMVVTGRASGKRAMVVLVSPSFELVIEERIERFWPRAENPLHVTRESDESELVVVGGECQGAYALRARASY